LKMLKEKEYIFRQGQRRSLLFGKIKLFLSLNKVSKNEFRIKKKFL
jgi:hypothetical protein